MSTASTVASMTRRDARAVLAASWWLVRRPGLLVPATAVGRFGSLADVAGVGVFLASEEAAYVTGSTYYVDGGLTQQVTKY